MRARAIMVLGTSSHVGKSLLTAALCRIFADQGVSVAPFKSQNMSLNSSATLEGLEIGRAQALQAEAARIPASVHMNPVLLKPAGNMTSQVVVRGKIWGRLSASDYHQRRVEELLPIVRESYEILAAKHEVIILEGAGSPAEINLKQHDIVNMRMAEIADAFCLLVGDIDRGGVFASLLGTVQLLDATEQTRIRGFLINKFRGDIALLEPGIRMMQDRLQKPCLGVVPYIHHLALEEEDSLGLADITRETEPWLREDVRARRLRIAVVALPSFSNFTDFDALRHEPSVSLRFCREPLQLALADLIILPGSKQTVEDLLWMRHQDMDSCVVAHAAQGLIVGICGGMQMLGTAIVDSLAMEHGGQADALGLLPFTTHMNPDKVTRAVTGRLSLSMLFGQPVPEMDIDGYEIHIGETMYAGDARTFSILNGREPDGCISPDTRIFGTYLHGIFDDDKFRHTFLAAARSFHQLAPVDRFENWRQKREDSFNRLADTVRESLDLPRIFDWVGISYKSQGQIEPMEQIR
jgi:adenosylcobyric acid synthase